jgi:hypothetical protein
MRIMFVTAALGMAVLLWAGLGAQQEVLPRPGPGSGITKVLGAVEVSNAPEVHASQRGAWQVAIGNTPGVRVLEIAGPTFVSAGQNYRITWTDGEAIDVRVTAVASDGWVQVESPRRRWLNLQAARAVEEAR